jgi:predicted AlkP superfamily pyrophosphatase or phosphodiesterase
LINNLKQKQTFDSTNIIIVSDHGLTEVDIQRTIAIEEFLPNEKYLAQWNGPVMLVESLEGRNNEIVSALRKNLTHAKVYLKNEIPEYFHFKNNEMISQIVIVADLGWHLLNKRMTQKDAMNFGKGNHGYDHNQIAMHGIFVAEGPAFKKHYNVGMIENIDIYPLLCSILNILPNKNIDGRLDRIAYILK